MPVEVDDELDQYAKKDDELEKYAAKPSIPGAPNGLPQPAQPIPQGLQGKSTFTERLNAAPNPGVSEGAGLREGLGEYVGSVGSKIGGGASDIAHGNVARGAHGLISGAGEALAAPTLPFLAAGVPLATGLGIGGGAVGSKIGSGIAEGMDATPDQAALAGDVGGLAGGFGGTKLTGLAGKAPGALGNIGRKILLDPTTGKPTLGPSTITERILRAPQAPVAEQGAPLPSASEFYENRAADITKRGREQDLLDRRAAMEARRKPSFERDATKLNVPFAGEEAPPIRTSPFGEATSSASPQGDAQLPSIGTPIQRNEPNVSLVSKFEPPAAPSKSRIIQPGTPEAEPPHVEGSYWSFGEGALRKAVMGGDRDAAIVYKQRFGQLPEGASYLTDVGAKPNKGLYRSERQ